MAEDENTSPGGIGGADLDWSEQALTSRRFGDVYFSAADGLGETRHVFLDGIGGADAWAGRGRFTVGELGFGTGLNFLALWDLWARTAGSDGRLDFISVEGYPLTAEDMARAHGAFPEFDVISRQLRAAWPDRTPEFHHLVLDGGRVRLTLLFGPALPMLRDLRAQVDAWFLDGFAPSKNPGMWTDGVFAQVARLSKPGTALATFSSAGAVRRGLAAVGFQVEKRPGFGGKRECLRARYNGTAEPASAPVLAPGASVAVIGAGIAGRVAARSLTGAGMAVTLFAGGGAGDAPPRVLVSPRLAHPADPYGAFMAQAFTHAARLLPAGENMGALHLPPEEDTRVRDRRRLDQLGWPEALARPVDADAASDLAGVQVANGGLYFPEARFLDPAACVPVDGVEVIAGRVTAVDGGRVGWPSGERRFDAVVLAAGPWCGELVPAAGAGLSTNRGQLTYLPPTEASKHLRLPISFGGHVTPQTDLGTGLAHIAGSSYAPVEISDDWQAVKPNYHLRPLEKLAQVALALSDGWRAAPMGGWAGLRAVTPDHLPVAGQVCGADGVYVLSGFGSRGYQTAFLAADMVTAAMAGGPMPVPGRVAEALSPGRFQERQNRNGG
ncbi:MAG: tRNA (5-methylaminomethyl-2-thiouridine)(34)-methyltransferase MnmD [Rhodospirillaceae bacterium]